MTELSAVALWLLSTNVLALTLLVAFGSVYLIRYPAETSTEGRVVVGAIGAAVLILGGGLSRRMGAQEVADLAIACGYTVTSAVMLYGLAMVLRIHRTDLLPPPELPAQRSERMS